MQTSVLKITLRNHEKSSETIRLKHKHDSLFKVFTV